MLKTWMHKQIANLERDFSYDAGYFHEVIDASPGAALKFSLFQIMAKHRDSVPKDAWYAAGLAAALTEDCGPCTQLGVDMALRDGMPAPKLSALLRGDIEQAGPDAALGFRYGIAVATNSPDALALSEQVEKRYGKRGQISLACAVACTRVYPALKRGLGHAAACSRIVVANDTIPIKQAA
jgi:hypothetical protein